MNVTIDAEGTILDGEEKLGKYLADSNTVLADRQLAPQEKRAVTAAVKEHAGVDEAPAYDIIPQNPPKDEPEPEKAPKPKAAAAPKPGKVGTLKEQYPEYPGQIDPAAGDKTPEFVAWLEENHPKEAAERYRGRIVGGVVR